MTTKAEWLALSERCEKATGHDRELDCAIYALAKKHMNPAALLESFRRTLSIKTMVDPYTASLDAITALIERELPGRGWTAGKPDEASYGQGAIISHSNRLRPIIKAEAATPALALCAAFAKAMAEKAA